MGDVISSLNPFKKPDVPKYNVPTVTSTTPSPAELSAAAEEEKRRRAAQGGRANTVLSGRGRGVLG
ncbi:MAG: hypothetical protein CUN56_16270, partial [Phototrophicales bacterium]